MNFEIKRVKIFVTIPKENTEEVRKVLCEAGAGIIGNYIHCTTLVKSTGTFIPNNAAKPFIGENNKLEILEEDKLEVICDVKIVKRVISELRSVHPYEELAIDIVPLIDENDLI